MEHVVILWEFGRTAIRQIFGPYGTEHHATAARDELRAWPALDGEWDVLALTRHGQSAPPPPEAAPHVPIVPYTHPAAFVWPAQPQWPYQPPVVWCDALVPGSGFVPNNQGWATVCSGNGLGGTIVYTTQADQPQPPTGEDPPDPPDAAVPAGA